MRKDLPEVESVWRKWRIPYVKDLEQFQKFFRRKIREIAEKENRIDEFNEVLSRVSCSSDIVYFSLEENLKTSPIEANRTLYEQWIKNHPNEPMPDLLLYAWALSFFAAYRRSKVVWNIDPDLLESVKDLPFPENTPASALRFLPCDCIVIPEPKENKGMRASLFWYDWHLTDGSGNPKIKSRITLRCGWLRGEERTQEGEGIVERTPEDKSSGAMPPNQVMGYLAVDVSDGISLKDSLAAGLREHGLDFDISGANKHKLNPEQQEQLADWEGPAYDLFAKALAKYINVLLYAAGCDDLVRLVGHEYQKPVKRVLKRQPGDPKLVKKDLSDPIEYDVGVQFGSAIRQYRNKEKESREIGLPTGRTVRPHVRRAHSHLYWTGSDRNIPRVRFLPPIPVKMSEVKEERDSVLVRPVS